MSLGLIFRTFLVIGGTSFGGGMVAYLREMLVTRRRWLDDDEFIVALEIGRRCRAELDEHQHHRRRPLRGDAGPSQRFSHSASSPSFWSDPS